jgi:mono/diheme cytochrome c family protein
MTPKNFAACFVLAIIFLGLAACGDSGTQTVFFGDEQPAARPQVPEEYSGLRNPYVNDPDQILAGERLYEANCSSCHGITGEGDGPASGGIDPPPGNLALRQPNMGDPYMFWRISEGGLMEPFNSIMPGWKGLLDEDDIWQIISYVRTMIVL